MADQQGLNMGWDGMEGAPGPGMLPAISGKWQSVSFLDVVAFEQRRSERYNHYFVIALLSPMKVGLRELVRTAAKALRASDLLGSVEPDGTFHVDWAHLSGRNHESYWLSQPDKSVLGIILPQTDRPGANTALRRITGMLGTDEAVSVRYAVYPDDSTDPSELLAIASPSPAD
jgi:hypothetical protein